jgi:hypothetical protein
MTPNQMQPHPLPKNITREEFNRLVTALYQLLTAEGIDPSTNLTVGEETGDGKTRPSFTLYISETARQLVLDRLSA